ncbi:DUF2510 domain-containing protein [Nonomuraea sp. NPDC046570]|uniref:DUF2510 domain-containing protein n=1 Tax=Nonomuraea sp. NPDC046570 TaxID=3155255 RepID=UPI0033DC8F9F
MTTQTPAGWYPDPYGSPQLRWWDGNQWTDATHPLEQPQGGPPPQTSGPQAGGPQAPGWQPQQQPQPHQQGGPPPWGGQTAQMPMPNFGPPPAKKSGALPWVLGGVAALVVLALIAGAAVFLLNRGGDTSALPTPPIPTEAVPETEEPTPEPSETPEPSDPPQQGALPQPVDGLITDPTTGLSYKVPSGAWTVPGPELNQGGSEGQKWSSAVQAPSHENYKGEDDWVGNVYTGLLSPMYPYTGVAGQRTTAATVFIDFARFYAIPHKRKIIQDKAIKIGSRDAWLLEYELDFTAESEKNGYKWKKEHGAVVVMDRGQNETPALVYISVPDNLSASAVEDVLKSLKES